MLAVFGGTAVVVYFAGARHDSPGARFSATAVVAHPAVSGDYPGPSGETSVPNSVLEAAVDSADAISETDRAAHLDRIRRALQVKRTEATEPSRARTVLAYSDADSTEAVRVLNRIAEGYAQWQRSSAARPAQEDCLKAKAAAASARQELDAAQRDFEEFLTGHFGQMQNRPRELASLAQKQTPLPLAESATNQANTPRAENPEWAERNNQLAKLEQHRAEMLLSRTPVHPAIQDLNTQIAQLEQRLGAIPRHLAGHSHGDPAVRATPEPQPPEGAAWASVLDAVRRLTQNDTAAAAQFTEKSAAVEHARQTYERLAAAERQARERELQVPPCQVLTAQQAHVSVQPPPANRTLVAALIAALTMALGTALAISGATVDTPLMSVGEVEDALALPVVGVVPVAREYACAADRIRALARTGGLAVTAGITLVVICLGSLFLFLA
ncbi:MAG: hypothetical protein HUU20_19290 [Pirellulales bacterium]|nr:hypothetical protein [Pirellulales bacterium]